MKLMTIESKIPALNETENTPTDQKMIYVKFFSAFSNWKWHAAEYDKKEKLFFGYVKGTFQEWGYFSLDELESINGPLGLKIERDIYFKPTKFSNIIL